MVWCAKSTGVTYEARAPGRVMTGYDSPKLLNHTLLSVLNLGSSGTRSLARAELQCGRRIFMQLSIFHHHQNALTVL